MAIKSWQSKLNQALQSSDLDRLNRLLSGHEHRLNTIPKGESSPILFRAALHSDCNVVGRLLELGANPNFSLSASRLPVMAAIQRRDLAMLKLLVEHGAELHTHRSKRRDFADKLGPYPAALIGSGSPAIVEFLLDNGFHVDSFENWRAQTPLTLAAEQGQARLVSLLLQRGAAVDLPRRDKRTPLHAAVVFNLECFPADEVSSRAHEAVISILLEAGADAATDDGRESVLESAQRLGNGTIIARLTQVAEGRSR